MFLGAHDTPGLATFSHYYNTADTQAGYSFENIRYFPENTKKAGAEGGTPCEASENLAL